MSDVAPSHWTPAHRAVLEGLSRGLTFEQVAASLGISVRTARRRETEARQTIGAAHTVEVIVWAVRRGII